MIHFLYLFVRLLYIDKFCEKYSKICEKFLVRYNLVI